jgi:hypothetical protein
MVGSYIVIELRNMCMHDLHIVVVVFGDIVMDNNTIFDIAFVCTVWYVFSFYH